VASPSYEMERLPKNLGMGRDFVLVISAGIIVLSMLMLFSSLTSSLAVRQYDLAIMRVLGASPVTIFSTVMWEGALVGLAGAFAGVLFGHGLAYVIAINVGAFQSFVVPQTLLMPSILSLWLALLGLYLGALAAVLPARVATRLNVASLLTKGTT
jgi:putative ABC transport system permease protein